MLADAPAAEPKLVLPGQEFGDWFVIRTRSRQEKILARDLRARNIGCFLPLMRVERMYCNRRMRVELPLFAGYLFLRGSVDDAYFADRSGHVAQIIQVPDQKRLDAELYNLAQVLGLNTKIDPYPFLKKGVRVEVRTGPLRGLQGLVEDRTRKHRLIPFQPGVSWGILGFSALDVGPWSASAVECFASLPCDSAALGCADLSPWEGAS